MTISKRGINSLHPTPMTGTNVEIRTAKELGINGAPPYALFRSMAFVIDDGVDAISGCRSTDSSIWAGFKSRRRLS